MVPFNLHATDIFQLAAKPCWIQGNGLQVPIRHKFNYVMCLLYIQHSAQETQIWESTGLQIQEMGISFINLTSISSSYSGPGIKMVPYLV